MVFFFEFLYGAKKKYIYGERVFLINHSNVRVIIAKPAATKYKKNLILSERSIFTQQSSLSVTHMCVMISYSGVL